jgi:hypothetical protein
MNDLIDDPDRPVPDLSEPLRRAIGDRYLTMR